MASLEDQGTSAQRIEDDRGGMAIEASIVRILKSRKRFNHNLLVSEVVNPRPNKTRQLARSKPSSLAT